MEWGPNGSFNKKKGPPPLAVYGMQNKTRVLPRGIPNLLAVLSIK